jgi:hypothetical protein
VDSVLLDRRRRPAVLAVAALFVVVGLVIIGRSGGDGGGVRPFHFSTAADARLARRAAAGVAHGLFVASPGGAVAPAARVDRLRPAVERAAGAGRVDPDALEGLVFLESAGRPDAMAGGDPSAAAGLTQILPETASSLLGMHVDLPACKRLTAQLTRAAGRGDDAAVARLARARRRVDDRFDPVKALAGTVRYLRIARRTLHRDDLALVSYHMGMGNVRSVLAAYGRGTVSYPTLFFGSAPDDHAAAWRKLSSFGDESSLYLWKVLAATEIMRSFRADRRALVARAALQTAAPSAALVLHPPGRATAYRTRTALAAAYASGALDREPADGADGLRWSPATDALHRGLRPGAAALLRRLGARVRVLAHTGAPLTVLATVAADATGWSFVLSRRYAAPGQAEALQFVLDRLTALNAIAWSRQGNSLRVTVAADVPGSAGA